MLNQILSIAGKPGLYKLVSQGKNMLIVEHLAMGSDSILAATQLVAPLHKSGIWVYRRIV